MVYGIYRDQTGYYPPNQESYSAKPIEILRQEDQAKSKARKEEILSMFPHIRKMEGTSRNGKAIHREE